MQISTKLILASASPRRKALLEQLGLTFTVQVSPADEAIEIDRSPADVVETLARRKALPVAAEHPTALTLAADTIVVHNDTILGKPIDRDDARRMLRALSGTVHTVHTGIALVHPASDRTRTESTQTHVRFASLAEDEINAYVDGGSPLDKAGSYGIQDATGPLFVEAIDGDYYTVVGLPLRRLYVTLRRHFDDLLLL